MYNHPLLNIIQELRSKELISLDQITVINTKINMLVINCLYSLLNTFHNLEKSHLESEDGKPDLSRFNRFQLSALSIMLRDDIKVIKELLDITYEEYIKSDKRILSIDYDEESKELRLDLPYLYYVLTKIDSYSKTLNHPFATETTKRSLDIFLFYSQIIESALGIKIHDIRKFKSLVLVEVDIHDEEMSLRKGLSTTLDSIEKFIRLYSNHVCVTKL